MRTKGAEMAGKDGDKALRRIIQMLIALSLLAERASGACYPVRFLVLLLLRPAFAVTCDYVDAPCLIPGLADVTIDNSPLGALRLAACFTALAAALQYELCEPPPFAREARRNDGDNGAQSVVQCLNANAPIGLPGSRAPPHKPGNAGSRNPTAETARWGASACPHGGVDNKVLDLFSSSE